MWEYSALFDMPGPTALEMAMRDPDWWKKEGCDLRVGQMAYRTTTTLAGDTLVAEIYPAWGRKKKTEAKRARHNLTPERIQKYNEQRARFRLELLLDTNFTADDLNMTLTYADAPREAEARKDVKNYIARLKRERKKRGLPEMKYVYALEDERDVEDTVVARFHLFDQNRGKETAKGKHHYSCSKNLTEPKVRSSMSRVGNAKVRKMARDFNAVAPAIMEKVYPGFEFVRGLKFQENESGTMSESCVRFSDYTDGVYIRVMMKRTTGGKVS